MSKVTSQYIGQKFLEAGVLTEEQLNLCSRIMFDVNYDNPHLIIELLADTNIVDTMTLLLKEMQNEQTSTSEEDESQPDPSREDSKEPSLPPAEAGVSRFEGGLTHE